MTLSDIQGSIFHLPNTWFNSQVKISNYREQPTDLLKLVDAGDKGFGLRKSLKQPQTAPANTQ